jgi:hypothetical protein
MAKLKKTCHELEKMINDAVTRSGRCSDVERVTVVGPLQREYINWDYGVTPKPSTLLISSDTWDTLNTIAGPLKAQYDAKLTELKTDQELAEMITEKLNASGLTVSVRPHQTLRWHAVVIPRPEGNDAGAQSGVNSMVRILRLQYDLKIDSRTILAPEPEHS